MSYSHDAEVLKPDCHRGDFRAALFDFDGTLSLFREGWVQIMTDLALEILEDPTAGDLVRDFILALNGQPSILQMRRIAEEARLRNKPSPTPEALLAEYHRRLMDVVDVRRARVTTGQDSPADWVVPNVHALLTHLQERGIELYVASGTELRQVLHEAEMLQVVPFFGERISGPTDANPNFTKGDVVRQILATHGLQGHQLIGFGDGVGETRAVKAVGGTAVGILSVGRGETGRCEWKRGPLVDAGADVLIPHYKNQQQDVNWLFGPK